MGVCIGGRCLHRSCEEEHVLGLKVPRIADVLHRGGPHSASEFTNAHSYCKEKILVM